MELPTTTNKGRTPKLICIVGTNGTGKTTLLQEFVANELSVNRRVLIVTPHFNEWSNFKDVPIADVENDIYNFKGIGRIHYSGEDDIFDKIKKQFFNGLLIFDDCRAYIKPNISQYFKNIMISRRQMKTDVICVAHSIVDIPVSVFYYSPIFILKKTTTTFEARKTLLMGDLYNRLNEAQARINKNSNPYYYELINS